MPTQATVQSVRYVFGESRKYRVPDFQRRYSWGRDEQWAPLWNDITEIAIKLLDGEPHLPHFMGAIVLQPQSGIQDVDVIDGQQRLTTVQITMAAIERVCRQYGYNDLSHDLHQYTTIEPNTRRIIHRNQIDQHAFESIVTYEQPQENNHPVALAYEFFQTATSKWVDESGPDFRRARCDVLKTAVLDHLQFVSILLDTNERPHDVFEVLNGRARALRQSDLIRNIIMYEAQVSHELEPVKQIWEYFDESPWWHSDEDGGKSRLDWFLSIWTAMKRRRWPEEGRVAASFRVEFEEARSQDQNGSVASVLEAMRQAGVKYRDIEDDRYPELERLKSLAPGRLAMPFFLLVYTKVADSAVRIRTLHALESYLMRQFLVSDFVPWPPGVGFFTNLLGCDPDGHYCDTIVGMLRERLEQGSNWWCDDWFPQIFSFMCAVRGVKRQRRMLMIEIEKRMKNVDRNIPFIIDADVVEIIPRKPPPGQVRTPELQAAAVSLGNLTLVPRDVARTFGVMPWNQQRAALGNHQGILLNADILNHVGPEEDWGSTAIRARTQRLTQLLLQIWPSAATFHQ